MKLNRVISLPAAGLAVAVAVLAGCNNPDVVAKAPVRVAKPSEVGSCKYLMNFSDKPGLYGALAAQGQAYARRAILEDAARAGANTVVFDMVEPGTIVTEIKATAYRC